MHPQIIKSEMGTCPICGMDLVSFHKDSGSNVLKINQQGQFLANIKTEKLGDSTVLNSHIAFPAKLTLNPQLSQDITARFDGRIEKIFVKEPGSFIQKGQPLFQVYSEQLSVLQREYLMALEQQAQFKANKTEQNLVSSAEQKLKLYGQSSQQISQLASVKQVNPLVTVNATESGTMSQLSVSEGQYITEGAELMRLENYNFLWVEIYINPQEVRQFKIGTPLKIKIDAWPNETQFATVDYVSPAYQTSSQQLMVRASIRNLKHQWQPGLQARAWLQNSGNKGIVIPIDAVINDAKGQHVWLRKSEEEFIAQKVSTGMANEGVVSILSGLNGTEEVVVKGAYLLYSEYQLKKGKHPLAN
jgi:Cu(I)/Ag(I) efflux system membrane fusion protein